jgi:hypothetical protein
MRLHQKRQEHYGGGPPPPAPANPAPVGSEGIIPNPKLKLLDQMRAVLRLERLIRRAPVRLTPLGP